MNPLRLLPFLAAGFSPLLAAELPELRMRAQTIDAAIQIGYGLARDGETNKSGVPKKFLVLSLLFDMSATYLPGALSVISPLFRSFARRARKKGIEQRLIEKYCG